MLRRHFMLQKFILVHLGVAGGVLGLFVRFSLEFRKLQTLAIWHGKHVHYSGLQLVCNTKVCKQALMHKQINTLSKCFWSEMDMCMPRILKHSVFFMSMLINLMNSLQNQVGQILGFFMLLLELAFKYVYEIMSLVTRQLLWNNRL